MKPFALTIPMRLVSEANARGRWFEAALRTREHRRLVDLHLRTIAPPAPGEPLVITLERVAPLPLDDDNLARALKGPRDQVACWARPKRDTKGRRIGDDRDPSLLWRCVQRRGRPREYALGLRVRPWSCARPGARVRVTPEADVVELVLTPLERAQLAHQLARTTGPITFSTEGLRLLVATASVPVARRPFHPLETP